MTGNRWCFPKWIVTLLRLLLPGGGVGADIIADLEAEYLDRVQRSRRFARVRFRFWGGVVWLVFHYGAYRMGRWIASRFSAKPVGRRGADRDAGLVSAGVRTFNGVTGLLHLRGRDGAPVVTLTLSAALVLGLSLSGYLFAAVDHLYLRPQAFEAAPDLYHTTVHFSEGADQRAALRGFRERLQSRGFGVAVGRPGRAAVGTVGAQRMRPAWYVSEDWFRVARLRSGALLRGEGPVEWGRGVVLAQVGAGPRNQVQDERPQSMIVDGGEVPVLGIARELLPWPQVTTLYVVVDLEDARLSSQRVSLLLRDHGDRSLAAINRVLDAELAGPAFQLVGGGDSASPVLPVESARRFEHQGVLWVALSIGTLVLAFGLVTVIGLVTLNLVTEQAGLRIWVASGATPTTAGWTTGLRAGLVLVPAGLVALGILLLALWASSQEFAGAPTLLPLPPWDLRSASVAAGWVGTALFLAMVVQGVIGGVIAGASLQPGVGGRAKVLRPLRGLVLAEMAAAVSLLAFSAYLVAAEVQEQSRPMGVDLEHVGVVRIVGPGSGLSASRWMDIAGTVAAAPGVHAAGPASSAPFSGSQESWTSTARVRLQTLPSFTGGVKTSDETDLPAVDVMWASEGALAALNVESLAGSLADFRGERADTVPLPVIIDEDLANLMGSVDGVVGTRIRYVDPWSGKPTVARIIAVLRGVRRAGPGWDRGPTLIQPLGDRPTDRGFIVVRSADPASYMSVLGGLLGADEYAGVSYSSLRLGTNADRQRRGQWALGAAALLLGVLTLLVAAPGLGMMVTGAVRLRWREAGIRQVLGATNLDVARLLISDTSRVTLIALVLGAAAVAPILWASNGLMDRTGYGLPIAAVLAGAVSAALVSLTAVVTAVLEVRRIALPALLEPD